MIEEKDIEIKNLKDVIEQQKAAIERFEKSKTILLPITKKKVIIKNPVMNNNIIPEEDLFASF